MAFQISAQFLLFIECHYHHRGISIKEESVIHVGNIIMRLDYMITRFSGARISCFN